MDPAPFALGDGPDACLLLHGLTGAPSEVRPVGEALAQAGIRAIGIALPGHASAPEELARVTRVHLLDAAREALRSLRGARRVFLCGLSAGALLSIRLAAETARHPELPRIHGLALLAPAISFAGLTRAFVDVIGRLPPLPLLLIKGARDIRGPRPDTVDGSYGAVPWAWGRELRLLSAEARADASRVTAPALVLHGGQDGTAHVDGARWLARALRGDEVDLRVFPRSGHVLPLDLDGPEVCRAVVSFFQSRPQPA